MTIREHVHILLLIMLKTGETKSPLDYFEEFFEKTEWTENVRKAKELPVGNFRRSKGGKP